MSTDTTYPGALPPPSGVVPDLYQGPTAWHNIWIGGYSTVLVVPTILAFLRAYTRKFIIHKWTKADYVFVTAWCLFVCEVGFGLSLLPYGLGHDAWNVRPQDFAKFAENLNIHQVVYMPAICLTKIAILFQLEEIFVTRTRSTRWWIIIGFIVFNVVFFTLLLFLEIFTCIPRAKIWDPAIPGGCINIQSTFVATGVINVLDDLAILALPIAWIAKLNISTGRKISVSAVFGVGAFAIICSVMRLAESIINVRDSNITVALLPVSLWATAEISAGLVVAALPSLPRLFQEMGPRTMMAQNAFYSLNRIRRTPKTFTNLSEDRSDRAFSGGSHIPQQSTTGNSIEMPAVNSASGGIVKTVHIEQTSTSVV